MILAAGASSRMGRPKQALQFEGESLLRRAVLAALGASCAPVVVVLGANADVSGRELIGLGVTQVLNPDWERGMGSSISTGVRTLQESSLEVNAAVLLLCDQPFVTSEVLKGLIAEHSRSCIQIVASRFKNTFGAPALFAKAIFPELLRLNGATGAKPVIQDHIAQTVFLTFPEGEVDIDTPDDLLSIIKGNPISSDPERHI